jgi:ABC-type antimicrobial peptide transport system permease subunit
MTPDGSTRCSSRSFDNGVVSGIALAAGTLAPARRALRIDPASAIRYE